MFSSGDPKTKGYKRLPTDEIHEEGTGSSDASDEAGAANGFASFINSPFILAIKNALKNSKNAFQTIINAGGGDLKDFIDTIWRLYQVFTNVAANQTNDACDHQNSDYIVKTKQHGIDSAPNEVGQAFFITSLVGVVAGSIKAIYQGFRKLTLNSYSYLLRQLNKISKNEKFTEANIRATANSLIDRNVVYSRLDRKYKKYDANGDNEVEEVVSKKSFGFFDFVNLFDGKTHFFKNYEKDKIPSIPKRIIGTAAHAVKNLWNFVGNNAFVFWLVWFPFVLAVGTAVATTSMFIVPIILSITFGITLVFTAWKVIDRIRGIKNQQPNHDQIKKENIEHERMVKDLKQRTYMKEEHRIMMAMLGKPATLRKTDNDYIQESDHDQIAITKAAVRKNKGEYIVQLERNKKEVLNSRLGKYLLSGSKSRMGVAIGMEVASAVVMTSMVFWLISTVALVAASGAITNVVFAFFDSGINTAIAGGIVSGFFSLRKFAEMRKGQQEFENKIHDRLTEAYKPEKPKFKGKTKADRFAELEQKVESRKAEVELLRLNKLIELANRNGYESKAMQLAISLIAKIKRTGVPINNPDNTRKTFEEINSAYVKLHADLKRAGKLTDNSIAYHYDIKKVDVYNDYYFEKQKDKATLWTNVKKGFNRAYAFLSGGQTGIFIVRTLFLVGGIAAAACTGAPLVFFAIAAVGAVAIGTMKLVQYCLERKRQKRENFVNTIDARISYLNKKRKELKALDVMLKTSAEKKPEIKPASHALATDEPKLGSSKIEAPIISPPRSPAGGIYPDLGGAGAGLFDAAEIDSKVKENENSTAVITSSLTKNTDVSDQETKVMLGKNNFFHKELVKKPILHKSTSIALPQSMFSEGKKAVTHQLPCHDEAERIIVNIPNNGIAAA